jgi:hypothetical protein
MADDNEVPISRWTPNSPKARFSWLGDPAVNRGRGKARLTGANAQAGLDYNKRLYAPDSGAMFQYGAPQPPPVPSYARGYQTQTAGGLARIARRYANPNPSLPLTGLPAVESGADYARRKEAAFGQGDVPQAGTIAEDATMYPPTENPNIATPVVAEPPVLGNEGTGTDTIDSLSTPPTTGGTSPPPQVSNPDSTAGVSGPTINPITGQPVAMTPAQRAADVQARWEAEGGSPATLHAAQRASGLRPRIDARAPHAANEIASPSAGVRSSLGFEPENFGRQSQWLPETGQAGNDISRHAAIQRQQWNQRFQNARAGILNALQN